MKLIRFQIILLIILSSSIAYSQDTLNKRWDINNQLVWSDFKGEPDSVSSFAAQCSCGPDYSIKRSYNVFNGKPKFEFVVFSKMNKYKSWVKSNAKSIQGLKHEQLHFDICEFFSWQLLMVFKKIKYTNDAKFENELRELSEQMSLKEYQLQKRYDDETKHSLDAKMQNKWAVFVKDLLNNKYDINAAMNISFKE